MRSESEREMEDQLTRLTFAEIYVEIERQLRELLIESRSLCSGAVQYIVATDAKGTVLMLC